MCDLQTAHSLSEQELTVVRGGDGTTLQVPHTHKGHFALHTPAHPHALHTHKGHVVSQVPKRHQMRHHAGCGCGCDDDGSLLYEEIHGSIDID